MTATFKTIFTIPISKWLACWLISKWKDCCKNFN